MKNLTKFLVFVLWETGMIITFPFYLVIGIVGWVLKELKHPLEIFVVPFCWWKNPTWNLRQNVNFNVEGK